MQKIMNAEAMREIDRIAMESHHIPSAVLMDAAGLRLSLHAEELVSGKTKPRILILCGKGNNGGDGYACARHLSKFQPQIGECFPLDAVLSEDTALFRSVIFSLTWAFQFVLVYEQPERELIKLFQNYDLIIDAVYGTGFHGEVRDPHVAAILQAATASGTYILSADLPSGVNATDGSAAVSHIRAGRTVTFTSLKTGLVLYPGADLAGEIRIEQIGIPPAFFCEIHPDAYLLDEEWAAGHLQKRPADAHKGTCGKVLCIGGSRDMPGSIILSARAALVTGSGLVKLASLPETCRLAVQCENALLTASVPKQDDAISEEALPQLEALVQESDAVLIGPGMTRAPSTGKILRRLLTMCEKPMVVDADALFALAEDTSPLENRKSPVIVTPHEMEFARLFGMNVQEVRQNRMACAREFRRRFPNAVLVLKGAHTIISAPEQTFVNPTGNEGMATAGSGDVLAGMCASLLADGMPSGSAAALAVYLHGKSGDLAAERLGIRSVTAPSILAAIPETIKSIQNVF
jgi:hydroxyethylthiazole kinase-like uncharacterized protein yjeF